MALQYAMPAHNINTKNKIAPEEHPVYSKKNLTSFGSGGAS